jgi:hypothetical protein
MSKLEYYSRPLVAFDPHNKEHRKFYYEFVATRSWGHCPVRFIVPDATGMDLIRLIQAELLNYYVTKEFEDAKRKRSKPTRSRRSIGLTSGGFELKIDS